MFVECTCARKQRLHELAADAAAAPIGAHVDRVLDGVAVAGPAAEIPKARKAEHLGAVCRHQHWIVLALARREPRRALAHAHRIVAKDRRRGGDHVVVDREDARKIRNGCVTNDRIVVYIERLYTILNIWRQANRMDIDQAIGARIRSLRETQGLSLGELAARSGVSKAMIARVEKAESSATAALLGRLCGALGVTLSALLASADRPTERVARA